MHIRRSTHAYYIHLHLNPLSSPVPTRLLFYVLMILRPYHSHLTKSASEYEVEIRLFSWKMPISDHTKRSRGISRHPRRSSPPPALWRTHLKADPAKAIPIVPSQANEPTPPRIPNGSPNNCSSVTCFSGASGSEHGSRMGRRRWTLMRRRLVAGCWLHRVAHAIARALTSCGRELRRCGGEPELRIAAWQVPGIFFVVWAPSWAG
jgi:hypothetical protein